MFTEQNWFRPPRIPTNSAVISFHSFQTDILTNINIIIPVPFSLQYDFKDRYECGNIV